MSLTFNGVLATSVSRGNRWHTGGIADWNPLEWAGAMAGEAGEACNAAKKLKRIADKIPNINEGNRSLTDTETASKKVAQEVADTIIYGLMLVARVGVTDFESILAQVFNAKSEEYGFPERL